jgi:flagellar basal body-associated protein FliL
MSKIFIALIIGLILAAAFISKGQANQEDTVLLEDEIIQVSTDDPEISSMLAKLSEQIRLVEDSAQIEVVKTEANSIEIHVKDQDIKDSSVQLIYVISMLSKLSEIIKKRIAFSGQLRLLCFIYH